MPGERTSAIRYKHNRKRPRQRDISKELTCRRESSLIRYHGFRMGPCTINRQDLRAQMSTMSWSRTMKCQAARLAQAGIKTFDLQMS